MAHRVLVIDDDPSIVRMLFRLFEKAGLECITATDGGEGIALALQRSPDAVVVDLRLPDMTGFEVIAALRAQARTAETPVWATSGEPHATDLLAGAAAGFMVKGFLQKPFPLIDLLNAVREALDSRHLPAHAAGAILEHSPLRIDLDRRETAVNGQPLKLGAKRFEVLCALAKSGRDGMKLQMLKALVWGSPDGRLNTVVKTVNRLRKDLARAAGKDLIVSIPGGYRLQ